MIGPVYVQLEHHDGINRDSKIYNFSYEGMQKYMDIREEEEDEEEKEMKDTCRCECQFSGKIGGRHENVKECAEALMKIVVSSYERGRTLVEPKFWRKEGEIKEEYMHLIYADGVYKRHFRGKDSQEIYPHNEKKMQDYKFHMDVIEQVVDTLKISGLSNSQISIYGNILFGRASLLKLPGTKDLLEVILQNIAYFSTWTEEK